MGGSNYKAVLLRIEHVMSALLNWLFQAWVSPVWCVDYLVQIWIYLVM